MGACNMYFDKFDICEAYYVYASLYHSGQWSKAYAIFGRLERMKFKPSPMLSEEILTENALEIFNGLIKRNY